jgi:hypothetical protein
MTLKDKSKYSRSVQSFKPYNKANVLANLSDKRCETCLDASQLVIIKVNCTQLGLSFETLLTNRLQ